MVVFILPPSTSTGLCIPVGVAKAEAGNFINSADPEGPRNSCIWLFT